MIEITAHRGASAYSPENTMPAFRLAEKMAADSIELDVHMTRDGKIVVIHDEKIDRTSNGSGVIAEMELSELLRYDFSYKNPEAGPVRISELCEVFEFLKGNNMLLNIELKNNETEYAGLEKGVLELIEKYGLRGRIYFSSFNHDSLKRLKEIDSGAHVGALYSKEIKNVWDYAHEAGFDAIHPMFRLMDKDIIARCHDRGVAVRPWTVDEEKDMIAMAEAGADAIITNRPDIAAALLRK